MEDLLTLSFFLFISSSLKPLQQWVIEILESSFFSFGIGLRHLITVKVDSLPAFFLVYCQCCFWLTFGASGLHVFIYEIILLVNLIHEGLTLLKESILSLQILLLWNNSIILLLVSRALVMMVELVLTFGDAFA